MNKSARKAVNLSVLQRHDPHISDILDSSSYVVVYKFDEDSQAWTKKGVEGTMFVFKRSSPPTYGFFIMNRLGLDNLMADLVGDMALQLTSDYIIYRDDKDIHGIWIYEPADRDRIGEKLLDCCKKAKDEDSHYAVKQCAAPSLTTSKEHPVEQKISQQTKDSSAPLQAASMDPLTRMLSEAMSKARVSEVSGVPSQHQDQQSSAKNVITHSSSSAQHEIKPMATGGTAGHSEESLDKNEIPSFLLAIISKDESKPSKFLDASLSSPKPKSQDIGKDSTQSSLLSSLTGTGKKSPTLDRNAIRQSGPPLSAELLPASVMPNGLYSNTTKMSTGGQAGHQQLSSSHPSPGAITTTTMLNRPNGVMSHPSPLQGPTFAYSPGMMPSPLVMPPMQGGPMMRPPPPPPLSFQHHPGHPMGIPPPPPPQAALNFPADAMHAAMGAVGFMQQQQRGFMGQESEVLSKAEFTQQFLGLLQNDPQFMDVLYSNYTAVLARRG